MKKRRGEIIKVGALFEKYKLRLKPPQGSVINEVIEVIEDITGITLEKTQIKYSIHTKVISLNTPSLIKQEIKLKQDEILIYLKARLGVTNTPTLIL